jgi:hypothetical protein
MLVLYDNNPSTVNSKMLDLKKTNLQKKNLACPAVQGSSVSRRLVGTEEELKELVGAVDVCVGDLCKPA